MKVKNALCFIGDLSFSTHDNEINITATDSEKNSLLSLFSRILYFKVFYIKHIQ